MCNTHSHGSAHGVRSDSEKAMADLRDDLIEELRLVNKYEAQIPVVGTEDFPEVDDVVKMLIEIRDDHKSMAARLGQMLGKMDSAQAELTGAGHHDHSHA